MASDVHIFPFMKWVNYFQFYIDANYADEKILCKSYTEDDAIKKLHDTIMIITNCLLSLPLSLNEF